MNVHAQVEVTSSMQKGNAPSRASTTQNAEWRTEIPNQGKGNETAFDFYFCIVLCFSILTKFGLAPPGCTCSAGEEKNFLAPPENFSFLHKSICINKNK